MLNFQDDTQPITLSMLNSMVSDTISYSMPNSFWVQAELANVNCNRGHCYMELVEHESDSIIAQAHACCWRNTWMRVSTKFISATGEELRAGMKVLLLVKANFHIAYGFSWIVDDIDPTFTLGDMAKRRQEILKTLEKEGVIDLNRSLNIPMFAKNIAVISSATAAGYGDFCNQLSDNEYGFAFFTRLFPALMQGNQVEQSVINALDSINECIEDGTENFDVVVIIRGGGSTTDLSCFDTLALAENVANFPLPIITGIGHDRDKSVLDLIACVSVKTPTAVAAYLIDNLTTTLTAIEDLAQQLSSLTQHRMETERLKLTQIEQYISTYFDVRKAKEENRIATVTNKINVAIQNRLLNESNKISNIQQRLPLIVTSRIQKEQYNIQLFEQRVKTLDPINVLRRGYSITTFNGHAVTDASQLHAGDKLTVRVANGEITSIVTES